MIAAPRARDRVAGLPPRAAPSCVRQFSGSRGPARLQALGWGREEGLLLCVPLRPPASPRGSRRMPRGARRPGSQLAEAGGERSGNGPSSPCEELASEARRLPGTRGGGGPPHRLARRVPGPVVMEKERGSQWACARDPPRKQTEPSEGCWGGAQKGGLNTVVGCEQLGPTAAGSLSRPGAGAGRGSVTGPAWGCGQEPCEGFFPQGGGAERGAQAVGPGRRSHSSLCSLTCWCSHREPHRRPGWVAAVTRSATRAGARVCRAQSTSCWDSAWTPWPLGTFVGVREPGTQ